MKKVLLIEFWNCTPHLETALEIAKNHSDAGDEVDFVFCGHDTPYQEGLSLTARSASFLTQLPERKGHALIASERIRFTPRCRLEPVEVSGPEFFKDINALKQFKYGTFEAGLAVASSLVSRLKNSNPDLVQRASEVRTMLNSTIQVYEFAKKTIAEKKPDIVYTFNGRFCHPRAVMRAAEESDVEIRLHERGASRDRYVALPFMPHDRIRIQEKMISAWNDAEPAERKKMGEAFYIQSRQGAEQSWKSFIDLQKRNAIPELHRNKKIVTYFSSSDDEFVAVGDIFKWRGWENQMEAVRDLVTVCNEIGGIQLFIRLHPHLREKSSEDQQRWLSLADLDGVSLISFDSEIDTYAMIDHSDVVVTGGSTVGIESVYWGTPSILLGPSFYSDMGATYNATSKKELGDLIVRNDLKAERCNSLAYGYYMATYGELYRHYVARDLGAGEFLGVDIQKKSPAWIVFNKIYSLIYS